MAQLVALPDGTELAGDYKIERVLGAGGFGVTYLAIEKVLSRRVSIKEYFPSDFAIRTDGFAAVPRSNGSKNDYDWGLERFWEEGQTLARFRHPNIVSVHRMFLANNTAYMVLHFEEGQSLKSWLAGLGRAPRQAELDAIVAPLLDALSVVHKAAVLHRDIAPDNIIIRKSGDPVLIDFGAARGDIAAHSKTKTVSALVKPGYSPYEQYAETTRQQGPWTDIYALAATLYHAIAGKRPPDSPSRMMKDELIPAREAALGSYRASFLAAIDHGLALAVDARPQSVAEWRGGLLAPPDKQPAIIPGVINRIKERTEIRRSADKAKREADAIAKAAVPPPPDAPGPKGGLLDFVDALQKPAQGASKAEPRVKEAMKPKAQVEAAPPAKAKAPEPAKPKAAAGAKAKAAEPAKPAADAAPARPLPPPAKRRTKPNPDVAKPRRWTRGLRRKLTLAAAISGAIIAFHDQIPRLIAGPQSAMTTGAIAPQALERRIEQAQEFKAHETAIDALALSGDGRIIVTAARDGWLRTWSSETHLPIGDIRLEDGAATSLSVRNNRAVTSHRDGTVAVYDLDARRRLYKFKRNDAAVWSAVFAGSEDSIAAAGHDWTVALWQTASEAEPSATLEGHQNAVQALAVEPSGRWLASGGADRSVRLWNLDRRELRRSYRNHSDYVTALAFSGDGGHLAVGTLDGAVKLWSVSTGRAQRTFFAHRARVTSIAFSANGDLLASASEDGSVRVRGLARTRLSWTLERLGRGATTLAFSNDGRTLLTGGEDGIVRLWPMPEPEIAQRSGP